jgi:hypothetical protein
MKKVNLASLIVFLNQINDLDPSVLPALIAYRVPCNKEVGEHPTIQTGKTKDGYEVGILGILNGLFGVNEDGWGYIAAHYKDKELKEIERFAILEPQPKPFTEAGFESLVDKASHPCEPDRQLESYRHFPALCLHHTASGASSSTGCSGNRGRSLS